MWDYRRHNLQTKAPLFRLKSCQIYMMDLSLHTVSLSQAWVLRQGSFQAIKNTKRWYGLFLSFCKKPNCGPVKKTFGNDN